MRFEGQILRSPFDLLHYATIGKLAPKPHLLVACMPKSGSTYLSNTLSRLPGFRKATLVRQYGHVEQDLDVASALRKNRYAYVAQHHVKYNENTQFVMGRFGVKPIVLVRNLYDCVISIRDHLRRESTDTPTAWIEEDHKALDDEQLGSLITRLAMPWYIHFYVSWMHCPDKLLVTYDQFVLDLPGTVEKICAHANLQFDRKQIDLVIGQDDPARDRRNIGRSGRGASLGEENKALIRHFRSFYPKIDFTPIGLD